MTISLHRYRPGENADCCPICLNQPDSDSVAHGKANWHPMCRKCAGAWFQFRKTCPLCNGEVKNSSSILSSRERAIKRLLAWIDPINHSQETEMRILAVLGTLLALTIFAFEEGSSLKSIAIGASLGPCAGIRLSHAVPNNQDKAALFAAFAATSVILILIDYEHLLYN